ncbi:protein DEFECTIVE IN MERISTEM SILENCING 3-like [Euphorbia lathyris]|uniref:protein DEFECTIVE IN MERISTEM SILENCING 3-like n=1 Tax=Euphorbia lathyris TaxID=212925 RepID=UPI00331446D4
MNKSGSIGSMVKEIKKHQDNLKFLKSLSDQLDERILDLQGRNSSTSAGHIKEETQEQIMKQEETAANKEETQEQIMKQEETAASLFHLLKTRFPQQFSSMPLAMNLLGTVAILGGTDNHVLNRLLSEYLGLEKMLAIVCRTSESVKLLEIYEEGKISSIAGLQGLGFSIGKKISGRFLVFCLEESRPYAGGFINGDPQKKLALPMPKLPNGSSPTGFIDFAVNMINMDTGNLSCVTPNGHGLRETLFYTLFSHLQVYKTRTDMLHALPCITEGALSLDGGIIKKNGFFALGDTKDVEVIFPVVSNNCTKTEERSRIEDKISKLKQEQFYIAEDMRREQSLLDKMMALSGKNKFVQL